jgi:hypothetical protein
MIQNAQSNRDKTRILLQNTTFPQQLSQLSGNAVSSEKSAEQQQERSRKPAPPDMAWMQLLSESHRVSSARRPWTGQKSFESNTGLTELDGLTSAGSSRPASSKLHAGFSLSRGSSARRDGAADNAAADSSASRRTPYNAMEREHAAESTATSLPPESQPTQTETSRWNQPVSLDTPVQDRPLASIYRAEQTHIVVPPPFPAVPNRASKAAAQLSAQDVAFRAVVNPRKNVVWHPLTYEAATQGDRVLVIKK